MRPERTKGGASEMKEGAVPKPYRKKDSRSEKADKAGITLQGADEGPEARELSGVI